MADSTIENLVELAATPNGGDLVHIIDDPSGTPTSKKITVTNLLNAGGGLTFAKVVKTADETVNNSTTFQDDDVLKFTANANKEYVFMLFLKTNSSAVADLKGIFSLPSGGTGTWLFGLFRNNTSSSADMNDILVAREFPADGSDSSTVMWGQISIGGTSGVCTFQWAQSTAEVSTTKIFKGSLLLVWEE